MLALLEIGFAEVNNSRIGPLLQIADRDDNDRHHRAAATSTSTNGMLRLVSPCKSTGHLVWLSNLAITVGIRLLVHFQLGPGVPLHMHTSACEPVELRIRRRYGVVVLDASSNNSDSNNSNPPKRLVSEPRHLDVTLFSRATHSGAHALPWCIQHPYPAGNPYAVQPYRIARSWSTIHSPKTDGRPKGMMPISQCDGAERSGTRAGIQGYYACHFLQL